MRFIDADKLIKEMLKPCPFVPDTTHYDNIYGIPIVEAIPIEWVKRWIEDNRANHQVIWMLDAYLHPEMDWRQEEKGNETD